MKFTEYLNNEMLCESVIEQLNEEVEIDELYETLDLVETELNEFLGLGKLASKIKAGADKLSGASDKADQKIDAAKAAVKNKIEDTKTAVKNDIQGKKYAFERGVNTAKETAKKTVADIGSKATAAKENITSKKEELKSKFASVLKKSKSVFAKFGEEAIASLKPAQKELAVELAPLFAKIKRGKAVGGEQALQVIAAVLAGVANADGGFPTKSEFEKKLTMLRSQPGLASFTFSAKYNGEIEADETTKKEPKAEGKTETKVAPKKPTTAKETLDAAAKVKEANKTIKK